MDWPTFFAGLICLGIIGALFFGIAMWIVSDNNDWLIEQQRPNRLKAKKAQVARRRCHHYV